MPCTMHLRTESKEGTTGNRYRIPTMTNKFKAVREKLHISQEAVARLLGVSLKTVYRWEDGKGASAGSDAILELIPILAAGKAPETCKDARKHGLDARFLAAHVPGCPDCRVFFAYIYTTSKLTKGTRA